MWFQQTAASAAVPDWLSASAPEMLAAALPPSLASCHPAEAHHEMHSLGDNITMLYYKLPCAQSA